MKEIIIEPYLIKFKPVLLSQHSKQETSFRIVIPIQASKNEKHLNWVNLKQSSPRNYMNILDAYQDYLDLILANIDFFFKTTHRQLKQELHYNLRTLLDIETTKKTQDKDLKKQDEDSNSQNSWMTKQMSAILSTFFHMKDNIEEEEEKEDGLSPNVNWVLVHKELSYLRSVVEEELKQKL